MATMIFASLPVKDLPKATAFYEALGYKRNTQFSNDDASSIVISDTIVVMLLTEPFWKTFSSKPIVDARTSSEVMLALSADSREAVDAFYDKAIAAGGSVANPTADHGEIYSRSFQDLDGHIWEVIWMDPALFRHDEG